LPSPLAQDASCNMRLPCACGQYLLARIYWRLCLGSFVGWQRFCGPSRGRWFRRSRRLWTYWVLRWRLCRCHGIRNVGSAFEPRLTSRLRRILHCQASLVVRLLTC
jgi:hypothetical protein